MRVAVYARFSSDMQRATSIDDQVASCRRYAKERGWTVLEDRIYADAAASGASIEGRPGLQALLRASALLPTPFDVVLVDDSSRVARDLPDALRVLQRLRFLGARVIYASQGIDSDAEQAETLITVHGLVDALYLRELAQKTRRGIVGQLERGFATGSKTFGYRTEPVSRPGGSEILGKRIVVAEDEAATVRQVFAWYADGVGVPSIVERLNQAGIRAPRGNRVWQPGRVRWILKNERYRGRVTYGKTVAKREPGTRRKVMQLRPPEEWRVADHPELRIIPEDLWERVQARRARVAEVFGVSRAQPLVRGRSAALYSRHLFSGFMTCSVCGGPVAVVTGGYGSPRYGCTHSWSRGRAVCDNRLTIRAKVADPLLLAGLQRELRRPETVRRLADMVARELARMLEDRPHNLDRARAERKAVAQKVANLAEAVAEGGPMPTLLQALARHESELRRLEEAVASLEERSGDTVAVMPAWVQRQLQDVAGLIGGTPERAKAEFGRLNVNFTLKPIQSEGGRPFLRAVGTADLSCISGTYDLHLPTRDRSRPGSGS